MNKLIYTLLFLMSTLFANAQEPQMADAFREDGKIYIVIAVLSIVFVALIVYLVSIDIKLKRLENEKADSKH